MKALIALLLMTTAAAAQMPPASMDLGTHAMSEAQLKGVYREHFGHKRFDRVTFIRVPFGQAQKACQEGEPLYGCDIQWQDGTSTIVYSFDPTGADPYMANNVLRHEFAHEFFHWGADHPHARP